MVYLTAYSNLQLAAPKITDLSATHNYNISSSELTSDQTLTLPALTGADVFVFADFAQTLSNKTLVAPIIINDGTLTLPSGPETLVGLATTDTLSNKTLVAPVVDTPISSWLQQVRVATTESIALASGPEEDDVVDGITLAADDRILIKDQATASENGIYIVQAVGGPVRAPDMAAGAIVSRGASVAVLAGTANANRIYMLRGNSNQFTVNVGTTNQTWTASEGITATSVDTLTNKTLVAPVISTITNVATLTLPAGPDTLVGRATADTLTNKTLVAPVIGTISNGGTLTLPTGPDTLVGRATADTLTNKTINIGGANGSNAVTMYTVQFVNNEDVQLTVTKGCHLVACDSSLTACTVTLPSSSGSVGAMITVADTEGHADAHPLTVQRGGSDTINGTTSVTINAPYNSITFITTGTGKWVLV